METTITTFNIESYEDVLALWQQCSGMGLSASDSRENIKQFLKRNPEMSFIARVNNEIIGAVLSGHDGRRGYIHHLAVVPRLRKQGIGRRLVDQCLVKLQNEGIIKCHIFIFNNNTEGLKFWESIGWSKRRDISIVSKFIN